jgi:hypothetical protein
VKVSFTDWTLDYDQGAGWASRQQQPSIDFHPFLRLPMRPLLPGAAGINTIKVGFMAQVKARYRAATQDRGHLKDLRAMIADYMEKGFLENIIDMFRHDSTLYPLLGPLIVDERMRVRIGVTALVETLAAEDPGHTHLAVPALMNVLMKHETPTFRGDAAHLLGLIGSREALAGLESASRDSDRNVREAVAEAIDDIMRRGHQ